MQAADQTHCRDLRIFRRGAEGEGRKIVERQRHGFAGGPARHRRQEGCADQNSQGPRPHPCSLPAKIVAAAHGIATRRRWLTGESPLTFQTSRIHADGATKASAHGVYRGAPVDSDAETDGSTWHATPTSGRTGSVTDGEFGAMLTPTGQPRQRCGGAVSLRFGGLRADGEQSKTSPAAQFAAGWWRTHRRRFGDAAQALDRLRLDGWPSGLRQRS